MANQHKHPVRGLRGIDDALWKAFDLAAQEARSDRSAVLRQFMEYYVAKPGAELPKRPPARPWSDA